MRPDAVCCLVPSGKVLDQSRSNVLFNGSQTALKRLSNGSLTALLQVLDQSHGMAFAHHKAATVSLPKAAADGGVQAL